MFEYARSEWRRRIDARRIERENIRNGRASGHRLPGDGLDLDPQGGIE
jgi:hypothetical protein